MAVVEPVLRLGHIAADKIVAMQQFVEAPLPAQHFGHPARQRADPGMALVDAVEIDLLVVVEMGEIGQREA